MRRFTRDRIKFGKACRSGIMRVNAGHNAISQNYRSQQD